MFNVFWAFIRLSQEPITCSEQLLCAMRRRFQQTSLFLYRFSREIWISNKFYKLAIKNRRLEGSLSDVLIAFTSFFCENDAKNNLICENAVA